MITQFLFIHNHDIRGPCPGLNTLANHNFLSHDGVTTFSVVFDAQQNVYNLGYDLSVVLALLGINAGGDLTTQRVSIGCDATFRTSRDPDTTGPQLGLNAHNRFEDDASLTRDDYFNHGDVSSLSGTLFGIMVDTCGKAFDREGMGKYRQQCLNRSLEKNSNFYFGPLALLLYGASSFLYELFPSGPDYQPDLATISSFFGAQNASSGSWEFNNAENIPDNWSNRKTTYSTLGVGKEILAQYRRYPILFGAKTSDGGFNGIDWRQIRKGKLEPSVSSGHVACLLFQLLGEAEPDLLNLWPVIKALKMLSEEVGVEFPMLGCPVVS